MGRFQPSHGRRSGWLEQGQSHIIIVVVITNQDHISIVVVVSDWRLISMHFDEFLSNSVLTNTSNTK